MFERQLAGGLVRQPFATTVSRGSYWLTRLQSRAETPAMQQFRNWLFEVIGAA